MCFRSMSSPFFVRDGESRNLLLEMPELHAVAHGQVHPWRALLKHQGEGGVDHLDHAVV